MRTWHQIFTELDIEPEQVAQRASLTRRDMYRLSGLDKLYLPVAKPIFVPEPVAVEEPKPLLFVPQVQTQPLTPEETQLLNESIFAKLATSPDIKQAVDTVNDWTRQQLKKDSWFRKLFPTKLIPESEISTAQINEALKNGPVKEFFGVDWLVTENTKSYSVATPAETKLVADETAVLADAQARTRGASNDDERRIAAAFWAQFHIYRRKPR